MKQPRLIIFLLMMFWLTVPHGSAQYYHFSQYSLEEGLPQSEVTTIIEDHLGYLWVGTNGGGLCRFNGKSFDVYNRKNGLHENIILGLYLDNNFNIWIGTPESISKYDGRSFKDIFVSDTALFLNEVKFYETSGGVVWLLSTLSDGKRVLFKIENDSISNAADIFPELGNGNSVLYVTRINNDRLVITTEKGIYELRSGKLMPSDLIPEDKGKLRIPLLVDRENKVWALTFDLGDHSRKMQIFRSGKLDKDVEMPIDLNKYNMLFSYQDREGGIWFSIFNFGVIRYIDGQWKVFSEKNGLPLNSVRTVHEDSEGNFWFGTLGAGLVRYSGDLFITFDSRSGLSDDIVRTIYQDSKGIYYFGVNGGGLNIYDGKKIRVVSIAKNEGSGYVTAMHEVSPGVILIATYSGLYEFNGSELRACNKKYGIEKLYPVSDIAAIGDTLFFSVFRQGFVKSYKGKAVSYNLKNSDFKTHLASSLFVDSKHNIWICTERGVWLYNGGFVNINKKYGLKVNYILQVTEDKTRNIWMATFTDGLLKFDGDTFRVIDSSLGLTSDNIYSVICDDDGNIWAGTQNGVDKLTLNNSGEIVSIENFGRYDGFTGIENNGSANFKDHEGNLWFGTIKGAIKYNLAGQRVNYLPPPVYIKDVSIGFKKIDWKHAPSYAVFDSVSGWFDVPEGLVLPHYRNHLSFLFDGLCYTVPEKVKYRWKLSPLEDSYTPATNINRAVYSSLPPGKYTLYVKACNNSGIWTETPAEYSFEIKPAWWQTMVFKLLLVLLILLLIFFIYRLRGRSRKQLKHEMETLLGSKSEEIKRQKQIIEEKDRKIKSLKDKNSELQNKIEKYKKNVGKIAGIGEKSLSEMPFDEVFMSVYNDIKEMLDICIFGVGVFNKESGNLEFRNLMIRDERAPVLKFPVDDTERLPVYSFINDRIIIADDINRDYKKYVSELKPLPGDIEPRSVMIVPLKVFGKVLGVLAIQSAKPGMYEEYHLNIAKISAGFMAVFLDAKGRN